MQDLAAADSWATCHHFCKDVVWYQKKQLPHLIALGCYLCVGVVNGVVINYKNTGHFTIGLLVVRCLLLSAHVMWPCDAVLFIMNLILRLNFCIVSGPPICHCGPDGNGWEKRMRDKGNTVVEMKGWAATPLHDGVNLMFLTCSSQKNLTDLIQSKWSDELCSVCPIWDETLNQTHLLLIYYSMLQLNFNGVYNAH